MLIFKDFVPKMVSAPGFLREGEYESLEAALTAANRWIDQEQIKLVQIETVVLPTSCHQ